MALRLIIPPTYGKYKKNAQMMYVFGTGRIVMLPVPKGASYRLYPSDFLVIRRTFYKQTFIKTGRECNFIDSAPLSSRFYEYLFGDCYDYRLENLSIG